MSVLTSAINPKSDEFARNDQQMKAATEAIRTLAAKVAGATARAASCPCANALPCCVM